MNIGFVFTNFNNSYFTLEEIRSLWLCDGNYKFRIVIVDNNSNENNINILQKLKEEYNNVDLIYNKENVGYFKGLNIGIKHLRTLYSSINCIVIGNNDLIFHKEFFINVYKKQNIFKKYAVISPDIIALDGVHQNPHVITSISIMREIIYDIYYRNYYMSIIIMNIAKITKIFTDRKDERKYDVAQEIYQGHGSCYILGPLFFEHYDELWAPSFLMGEEYFLSKMLKDKGLCVYFEPSISVNHCCHVAVNKISSRRMWEIAGESHKIYRKHVKLFK
jgi:GT2 family glycosyltransferase